MAKPILVANWKNHPSSLDEAKSLIGRVAKGRDLLKKVNCFIAPPFPYLVCVAERLGSFARLASQNIAGLFQGAATGEITPDILKSLGVRLAIIGHSERRALGETSLQVSQKVKIALLAGILPLICVGEERHDPEGEYFEFLRDQIKESLASVKSSDEISKIIIAYEPVWAIGKTAKDAITRTDLIQSIMFIRKVLSGMFGRALAEKIPILYGGSVEPENASSLAHQTGIRGFLVGHASLDDKLFKMIAESLISK